MSLKLFHVCFITLSIALCFVFGWWSVKEAGPYLFVGIASFAAGLGLFFYGSYFLNKIQKI